MAVLPEVAEPGSISSVAYLTPRLFSADWRQVVLSVLPSTVVQKSRDLPVTCRTVETVVATAPVPEPV